MPARHVEHCMGTVFSFDIRDDGDWEAALVGAVAWLHRVDRIFSTYKSDSDITRLQLGEITVAGADPHVPQVLDLCDAYERLTGGFFSARWNGGIDPTGLVKGWAVERASDILREHGSRHHAVNGGGDIQAVGGRSDGQPWRIGISDPADRAQVVATVSGFDVAVATSGNYERGAHVLVPATGEPVRTSGSLSVCAARLTHADVCATAALAMRDDGLRWLRSRPEVSAILLTGDGGVETTSSDSVPSFEFSSTVVGSQPVGS